MVRLRKYLELIDLVLTRKEPIDVVARFYFSAFADEPFGLDAEVYGVLQEVFEDFDAVTDDEELWAFKPSYYIDERTFRDRLARARVLLAKLVEQEDQSG